MPSIEALAMAGVDCVECGISLEERERRDTEKTPLYLLADQGEEGLKTHEKDRLMVEQWLVKNKMEAWPKVAARPVTNGVSNIQSREKKRKEKKGVSEEGFLFLQSLLAATLLVNDKLLHEQ
ncbi:hypothetical protein POTOM_020813 [Populus tomentosa]|uniref:Uncharacterized protein n=1 Tax=Populus tomentosa TaxID=118781 RepID=A0A8X7ZLE9_POPTO|nr:hypothetical protein POTOM_020813 [Populus tomentosa]